MKKITEETPRWLWFVFGMLVSGALFTFALLCLDDATYPPSQPPVYSDTNRFPFNTADEYPCIPGATVESCLYHVYTKQLAMEKMLKVRWERRVTREGYVKQDGGLL
jgi:hypothetical protein